MNEDNEEKVVRDKKLGKLILIINLVLLIPLMGILSFNFVSKNIRKSNEEVNKVVNKVVNKELYKEAEEILVEINTTKSDEGKAEGISEEGVNAAKKAIGKEEL